MAKKKVLIESRNEQQLSNISNEHGTMPVKVQGTKKKRSREQNEVQGQSKGKKKIHGGIFVDSAGKTVLRWSPTEEIVLLEELGKLGKRDASKPLDNSSINWEQLAVVVGERLQHELTRTQVYEKARRLKERYFRNYENIRKGKSNNMTSEEDTEMYKLSQVVWGNFGIPGLEKDDGEHDLPSENVKEGSIDHTEADVREVQVEQHIQEDLQKTNFNLKKKPQQELNDAIHIMKKQEANDEEHNSHGQTESTALVPSQLHKRDKDTETALNSKVGNMESIRTSPFNKEVIKGIMQDFKSEQEALLKDLENDCTIIVKGMQEKILPMLNVTKRPCGTVRAGLSTSSMNPHLQGISQSLAVIEHLSDSDILSQEWQKQYLQELNLTSLKLDLMLNECKREKEKLERLVSKS
ncbi:hypothetical protein KP509_18G071200 [Ceratopteris richardii]|uniref:Glabrous enhancer-binding protein-like DBD domain-containing protein n=1 Tax=Ceratopteris richardii TaxID=49495 RepID=A0A8T2SSQ1_CERRI|nr:hypothetical protein KP509_18G071200 [Ceratopteris richardii]KAH7366283.1 hypothetical protein KP509_18G071200 [Ceratopteris richardii]